MAGNLQHQLEAQGFTVAAFDIVAGPAGDLADDAIWDPLLERLRRGEFFAVIVSPPCGTFSRVRMLPGGPPPLRGITGKDRYGLAGLDFKRAEQVRPHNILALRSITACRCMYDIGGIFVL